MDMFIKIMFLVVFFAVMIGVGIYCRKQATNVNGFVLGNRSVGPWLTAFAFGTSYFSAVIFVGYAGQFTSCLEHSWQAHPCYDTAPRLGHNAGFLCKEI